MLILSPVANFTFRQSIGSNMAVHNSVQVAILIVLVPSICLYYLFRQQFNYEAIDGYGASNNRTRV
jgi:hypothetical protein